MDTLIVIGSIGLVLYLISRYTEKTNAAQKKEEELIRETEALWKAGKCKDLRGWGKVRIVGAYPSHWRTHVYNPEPFFMCPVGFHGNTWNLYSTNINMYPLVRTGKEIQYGASQSTFKKEDDAFEGAQDSFSHYMDRIAK